MDALMHLGLAAAGITMLCVGADRLVAGAAVLAAKFGISGFVIGATVVAYGTSTPELAASLQAAIHGETGLILGNVVGSNIANIGMVLGAAAMVGMICVGRTVIRRDVPIVAAVSVLLLGVSVDGVVGGVDGVLLLGGLAAFTVYVLGARARPPRLADLPVLAASTMRVLRRPHTTNDNPDGGHSLCRSAGMAALGGALLYGGAILTVDNSVAAAGLFGVTPHAIAIVVIAVGTSLPELITTVAAVRRGHSDIGVANIIGSNVLNVLFVAGIASTITDLVVGHGMWLHYTVMLGFTAAFLLWRRGTQARWAGPALVGAYAVYLATPVLST